MATNKNLESIANSFAELVLGILQERDADAFAGKTTMKKKATMEYDGKLRISGMDIFNESTYISAVSFYSSEKAMASHQAIGATCFYVLKEKAPLLYKNLGLSGFNDEDDDQMVEYFGKFVTSVVDKFKSKAVGLGYSSLIASPPANYINSVPVGIDFSPDQFDQYQISFPYKGNPTMAADITMAAAK